MIFNGTSAWGYINRYSATRWNMILTSYDDSTYVVNIQYNNGTFKYTDLNSKLAPQLSTSGLTQNSKAGITAGGYARIGKLVVVNIRVNVTEELTAGQSIVSGFPVMNANYTCCSVQNNKNIDISMDTYGSVSSSSTAVPTGTLILTFTYICA